MMLGHQEELAAAGESQSAGESPSPALSPGEAEPGLTSAHGTLFLASVGGRSLPPFRFRAQEVSPRSGVRATKQKLLFWALPPPTPSLCVCRYVPPTLLLGQRPWGTTTNTLTLQGSVFFKSVKSM